MGYERITEEAHSRRRIDMEMQRRMLPMGTSFETREDGDNLTIEGYFAVFNSIYDMGNGMTQSRMTLGH